MAYPERLLSPDEHIVTQFRPHWQALLTPISLGAVAIAGWLLSVLFLAGTTAWLTSVGILGAWILLSARILAHWFTTQYVLTTERVVRRSGVLARAGTEIPLEVITNVAFKQSALERLVRSGDLLIESAGESGQSRFTDIPDPEGMQSTIYQAREKRMVALNTGSPTSVSNPSVADEMSKLATLRDDGVLSDEEFETQKRRLLD